MVLMVEKGEQSGIDGREESKVVLMVEKGEQSGIDGREGRAKWY